MDFFIADAFTREIFGGNPAGVVLVGESNFPKDETMQKCAAELRYSETVFIKRIGEDEFHFRYFTPAGEVDLCGHATIAAFTCLLQSGRIKDNSTYKYHTLAGDLRAYIENGAVMMDMADPKHIGTIEGEGEIKRLYEIMGADTEGISLKPMMISTGLPDIMMPLDTKEALYDLKPDFPTLSELSKEYEVVGVHAFCIEEGQIFTRNFAPLYDIDEEAATGTSNGALTYYLYKHDLIKENQINSIIQGETMGRPSLINTVLSVDDTGEIKIQVGGSAIILAKGEINLE